MLLHEYPPLEFSLKHRSLKTYASAVSVSEDSKGVRKIVVNDFTGSMLALMNRTRYSSLTLRRYSFHHESRDR